MTLRMGVLGFLVGAVGAVGAVGGCSSSTIDGPITYLSTGGFTGTGDGTAELRVEVDGTVARTKSGGGSETATLDTATLDALHDKILAARFPTLAPLYPSDTADDFIYSVSAQVDGTTYVVAAHQMAPPPAPLQVVIDALGDIGELPLDWH